jgi:glycosyltransferase involved in cell wall biosynthesis
MIIAFDGGAFQQDIAAGIFNVSQGFLNASAKLDPSIEYVLVADPRLGPVKPQLINKLTVRPDTLFGEIGPAYGVPENGFITDDPDIYFIVDSIAVRADRFGAWICYQGPAPRRSFIIASRSARPCDVKGSADRRKLGICFTRMMIKGEKDEPRNISYDCPDLSDGFHSPEAGYRWTTGRGIVPIALLPRAGVVCVALQILDTVPYRLSNGQFDRAFNEIHQRIAACSHRLAVDELAYRLRCRGVSTYFANHFLPAAFPGTKLVAWAHDIIPILFPHFFMADAIANFNHVADVFRKADHIFSNSEKTKEDLLMHLEIDSRRVTVTGIDVAEELQPPRLGIINAVLEKFNLPHDVILCVGTLEPRKNHLRLVQAYHQVFRADGGAPRLVFVGKPGWSYQGVLDEIRRLGLEHNITLLSDVSGEELAALYADALFVAYPSLYEGFGLPVLEAMACGKAVLTSRNTSMSEVAGEAAFLVDPYDVSSIAGGLIRLIHDRYLRTELALRGRERRANYSWENTADRVLEVLRSL